MPDRGECAPGCEKDVIAILLEEYRPLRAEITSKLAGQSNLLAFGVAGLGVAFALGQNLWAVSSALILLLVSGLGFYVTNMWIAAVLATQVLHVEQRINELARLAYEMQTDVLTWESRWQDPHWESTNPLFRFFVRRLRKRGGPPSA